MPTPCPSEETLLRHVNGELEAADEQQITEHLDECSSCQQTLEAIAAAGDSLLSAARHAGEEPSRHKADVQEILQDLKERNKNADSTLAFEEANAGESLDFLSPSDKPGHLGRLDHYEILEVVGQGGMGVVLKALDEKLHRIVAVKVMSADLAAGASARSRFNREAKSAAAVAHDHVVTIHAVEDKHRPPYLVMEFVEGKSLQQRLDEDGPLDLKEILRIGHQTACGLAASHKQGLVHRDIKPANILLENGVERVKITDFGLARAIDDASITQSGVITGTPMYMSPEQAGGENVDHRSDLFSLGSVLYAMCTGRPPFRANGTMAVMKRVCEEEPRAIREINPDVPLWLCDIIGKLHAKKPEGRFHTAEEVAILLQQHLAHLQQPALVTMPQSVVCTERPLPTARRPLWPVVVVGGFFLCLLMMFAAGAVLMDMAVIWPITILVGLGTATGYAVFVYYWVHPRNNRLPAVQPADPPLTTRLPLWPILLLGAILLMCLSALLILKATQSGGLVQHWPITLLIGLGAVVIYGFAFYWWVQPRKRSKLYVPVGAATYRPRGKTAFIGIGIFLIVCLAAVLFWTLPSLIRFSLNQGVIEIGGMFDPEFEKVIIRKGDRTVATLERFKTDSVQLTAGEYTLEFIGRSGYRATKIMVDRQRTLPFWFQGGGEWSNLENSSWKCKLKPGEYVDVAVALEKISAAPLVKLAKKWGRPGERSAVHHIEMSSDGEWLVTRHSGGQLTFRQTGSNKARTEGVADNGDARDMRFSPDGKFLAYVLANGRLGTRPASDLSFSNAGQFADVAEKVRCVAWAPDNRTIVTGGQGKLHFWDAQAGGEPTSSFEFPGGALVNEIAYSDDGTQLAAVSGGGRLVVWHMTGKNPAVVMDKTETETGQATTFAWLKGNELITGGQDGKIRTWPGKFNERWSGQRQPIRAIAVSPDRKVQAYAGFGSDGHAIYVYSEDFKKNAKTLEKSAGGHASNVTALTFTRDGKYLLSGSEDGTIKVWEFAKPLVKKDDGFVQLFNGKDLAGWKQAPRSKPWLIDGGVLQVKKPVFAELTTERADYTDLHLRMEVFATPTCTATVNVRSDGKVRSGYAVSLARLVSHFAPGSVQRYTQNGISWRANLGLAKPDHWNTIEVIVKGKRIITKVNGKVAVDRADETGPIWKGAISIYNEASAGIVKIRNLEIKEF